MIRNNMEIHKLLLCKVQHSLPYIYVDYSCPKAYFEPGKIRRMSHTIFYYGRVQHTPSPFNNHNQDSLAWLLALLLTLPCGMVNPGGS